MYSWEEPPLSRWFFFVHTQKQWNENNNNEKMLKNLFSNGVVMSLIFCWWFVRFRYIIFLKVFFYIFHIYIQFRCLVCVYAVCTGYGNKI